MERKEGVGGKMKSGGVFFPNPTDTFIKPLDLCACNSQTTLQEKTLSIEPVLHPAQ